MILCDTNILIHYFNFDGSTVQAFDFIGRKNVVLPAIVVMELYRGMRNKRELINMRLKLSFYDALQIDEHISDKAVELMAEFKLSHDLRIPDALIGATAVISGLPLFTYNTKDFAFMPGIILYNPSK